MTITILFEARITLDTAAAHRAAQEIGIVPQTPEEREKVLCQAVQNEIGHTGAQVSCILEEK